MDGLASLAQGSGAAWLESTLPAWLMRQRWFGSKSKTIEKVDVVSHAAFSPPALPDSYRDVSDEIAIFFVKVNYRDGGTDTYQVPMALRSGEKAGEIAQQFPHAVISNVTTSSGRSILYDAMFNETFRQGLLKLVEDNQRISLANVTAGQEATPTSSEAQGFLRGKRSIALIAAQGSSQLPSRVNVTEQSNTSIFFDQKMIMKLFRKLQPDENPDIEIGRFLTEVAHFPRIANFLGEISQFSDGVKTSTAILQELVPNEGDCWSWTLEELGRFYESVAACPPPTDVGGAPTLVSEFQPSSQIIDHAGLYLESAALLGRRTAEMHLALATDTDDPAFRPETFAMQDMQSDAQRLSSQVTSALEALKSQMATISDGVADNAGAVLSRRVELLSCAKSMSNVVAAGSRIRIHGDYHLGQLLRVKNDFVILDFEGEPARPIEERRRKQCSLKDVAGMIRSFSYAAWSGFDQYIQRHPDRRASMEPWVRLWQNSVSSEFLKVYWNTASERLGLLPSQEQSELLLKAYLLEKALYELQYELNNRPEWMHIPLDGILDLSSDTRSATEV
jgi:maltose alpha-D-glucosyltransferase/alpha-amylase